MRSTLLLIVAVATTARAQAPGRRAPNDTLHSPVVGTDGQVTFQLFAPKATAVTLRSEGPAVFANQPLVRNDQGVWTYTVSLPPDLYIYWYDVDSTLVS